MDINSLPKDKGDKFLFINDFQIDQNLEKVEFNAESKNVIVLCLFHRPQYIRFGYLCLKSILKNTDALDYDIRIFTDELLENEVRQIFEPIIGHKIIIDRVYKHDIFRHLEEFEKVCLLDADGLVFTPNKEKIFNKIFSSENILMGKTDSKIHETFTSRAIDLNWSEEQMKHFNFKWITNNQHWHLAGISMYPMKYFEDDFIEYSFMFMDSRMHDDEAVIMNYMHSKGVEIHDIKNFINWYGGFNVLNYQNNHAAFIHPFEGGSLFSKDIYNYVSNIYNL